MYADVRSNGWVYNSGIWNKSSLLRGIQDGSVKLPGDKKLSNWEVFPYVFLRDDAFALKSFLKPFIQQGLTGERRVYDYRNSRVRRISENLFGILATRWKIICTHINLEPKYVKEVILAALILYNMLIKTPISVNVYRPADCILENREVSEGEWPTNTVIYSFYSLQVRRTGYNASLCKISKRKVHGVFCKRRSSIAMEILLRESSKF